MAEEKILNFEFENIPDSIYVGDTAEIKVIGEGNQTYEWWSNGSINIAPADDTKSAIIEPTAPGQIRVNVRATEEGKSIKKYFYVNSIEKVEQVAETPVETPKVETPISVPASQGNLELTQLPTQIGLGYEVTIEVLNYVEGSKIEWKLVNAISVDKTDRSITVKPIGKGDMVVSAYSSSIDGKLKARTITEVVNVFTPIKEITKETKIKIYESYYHLQHDNPRVSFKVMRANKYLPKLYYLCTGSTNGIVNYELAAIKSDLGRFEALLNS